MWTLMKQRGFLKATSVMSILFYMIVLCQLKQICDNEVKILAVLHILCSYINNTYCKFALHHNTIMIAIFVNHVVIIELQLY